MSQPAVFWFLSITIKSKLNQLYCNHCVKWDTFRPILKELLTLGSHLSDFFKRTLLAQFKFAYHQVYVSVWRQLTLPTSLSPLVTRAWKSDEQIHENERAFPSGTLWSCFEKTLHVEISVRRGPGRFFWFPRFALHYPCQGAVQTQQYCIWPQRPTFVQCGEYQHN